MRFILVVLLILFFNSCIQEIPIDIQVAKNQLVVGSVINPEKLIALNVSYINPFGDSAISPKITKISIFEDGILIDNPAGQGPKIYSSTYPKEGSEYELTVLTETDSVTARTTIPNSVTIGKADYWITNFISQTGERLIELSISWDDPPAMKNYYELMLLEESKTPYTRYRWDEIDDLILLQEGDLNYEPTSFVMTDKQFDGKTITIQFKYPIGETSQIYRDRYVLVRSISQEYYHFMKSWYRHLYQQNTSMNVEMIREDYNIFPLLFQGDPIPLYSNIDRGYGIFAGYSHDIRKLKFIK